MPRDSRNRSFSPRVQFFLPSVLGVALGTSVGHWGLGWAWLWAYLAAVNLVTFILYGYDKWASTIRYPRVPERVLHAAAIAGGTPAAYASQKLFRHKTIKSSFQSRFWLIVAIQVLTIIAIWWYSRH